MNLGFFLLHKNVHLANNGWDKLYVDIKKTILL